MTEKDIYFHKLKCVMGFQGIKETLSFHGIQSAHWFEKSYEFAFILRNLIIKESILNQEAVSKNTQSRNYQKILWRDRLGDFFIWHCLHQFIHLCAG